MSDLPAKPSAAAAPKDKWLQMLNRLADRSDRLMQLQQDYVTNGREAGLPIEDLRALDMEAADAQALMNIVGQLRSAYVRQKEKGKVYQDVEDLILAAQSAYAQMAAQWKKREAA